MDSGLENLYKEIIIDHYKNPRNKGSIDDADIVKEGVNPLCGDELTLYLKLDNDTISDIKIVSSGCSISLASASMMSGALMGKTLEEAKVIISTFKELMQNHEENISNEEAKSVSDIETESILPLEIQALKGVVQYPVRIKCATLSWNTATIAIEEII